MVSSWMAKEGSSHAFIVRWIYIAAEDKRRYIETAYG
jgi:hypothetical protein